MSDQEVPTTSDCDFPGWSYGIFRRCFGNTAEGHPGDQYLQIGNACYIGETKRYLKTRIDKHLRKEKISHILKHL